MPYGVSMPRFLAFCAAAFLSSVAGAQVVHLHYRPLDDLDELVEDELQKKKQDANNVELQ